VKNNTFLNDIPKEDLLDSVKLHNHISRLNATDTFGMDYILEVEIEEALAYLDLYSYNCEVISLTF